MSEKSREQDPSAEARPDPARQVLIAEIYFACRDATEFEDLDQVWTETGVVSTGVYRLESDDPDGYFEKFVIRSEKEASDPSWVQLRAFSIHREFDESQCGADLLQTAEDRERFGRMPAVSSIDYQVYLTEKGFHSDISLVTFDAVSSTEEELSDHGMCVGESGMVEVADPEKAQRLMDALNDGDPEQLDDLLSSLQMLEHA